MDERAAKRVVRRFVRLGKERADIIRKVADAPENAFLRGMAKAFDAAYLEASAAYDALPFEFKTVRR